jgi:hypothetical protein
MGFETCLDKYALYWLELLKSEEKTTRKFSFVFFTKRILKQMKPRCTVQVAIACVKGILQ